MIYIYDVYRYAICAYLHNTYIYIYIYIYIQHLQMHVSANNLGLGLLGLVVMLGSPDPCWVSPRKTRGKPYRKTIGK